MQTPGFRFQTIGIEGVFVCNAMKQLPNILTGCRILFSVALIFVPLFGLWFFVLYIAAGLTDIADGIAARHLDAESRFGALFDSFADVFFLIICTIRILPVLSIDRWLWIWMLIIVLIKIVSMISALVYKHSLVMLHTPAWKICGGMLFLLPLTINIIPFEIYSSIICCLATFAAIQEGHMIRQNK